MVAVTYGKWSFTRGSNCKALTGKVLVHEFWIGGLLWEVVPHGGSTVPSTDVIQLTLTLQMITARQSMSMQQSYLVLRQPSAIMLILLIDLLKKIVGKKGKLLRFLHRVGLELVPAVRLL